MTSSPPRLAAGGRPERGGPADGSTGVPRAPRNMFFNGPGRGIEAPRSAFDLGGGRGSSVMGGRGGGCRRGLRRPRGRDLGRLRLHDVEAALEVGAVLDDDP